jgi:streptogramin lyase
MSRLLSFLAACSIVWGCSMNGTGPAPVSQIAAPEVFQKGSGAQFVQFKTKTLGFLYSAIDAGPDGNIWFLDENAGSLVRMGMSGGIKEFSLSGVLGGNAVSMTVGADHKFYIGSESARIVRVTTSGVATFVPIPSGDTTAITGMALGPDGNVWFGEFNHIGKITPAGKITEFPYPSGINQYGGVSAGSDGNVWFAQSSQNAMGKVTKTGKITMFTIQVTCIPAATMLAKDKNVWFACLTNAPMVGRITPSGKITLFTGGGTFNSNETEMFGAVGPDGNPWFASGNNNVVFRVDTSTGAVTTFNPPLAGGERPDALAAGPDGNIWIDTVGGFHIDVLIFNPMRVTPTSLTFSLTGQTKTFTVSQHGVSSWKAMSSNTAVATVTQGSPASTFKVKSIGVGSCNITITDSKSNSTRVRVKVL